MGYNAAKTGIVLRTIITTALVPIALFVGDSDFLVYMQNTLKIIPESWDVTVIKFSLYGIGTASTIIFLSVPLAYKEIRYNVVTRQVMSLIKYNKDNLLELLFQMGMIHHKEINVRIYVPKRSTIQLIVKGINKRFGWKIKEHRWFVIRNIEVLADKDTTEGLVFKVSPEEEAEWVVGECYNTKHFIAEDNLKDPVNKRKLTCFQDSRTSNLAFCMCYPIIDKDTDDVIAIVAFDSEREIKIDSSERSFWVDTISKYCFTLFDYTPELFK